MQHSLHGCFPREVVPRESCLESSACSGQGTAVLCAASPQCPGMPRGARQGWWHPRSAAISQPKATSIQPAPCRGTDVPARYQSTGEHPAVLGSLWSDRAREQRQPELSKGALGTLHSPCLVILDVPCSLQPAGWMVSALRLCVKPEGWGSFPGPGVKWHRLAVSAQHAWCWSPLAAKRSPLPKIIISLCVCMCFVGFAAARLSCSPSQCLSLSVACVPWGGVPSTRKGGGRSGEWGCWRCAS